MYRKYPKSKNIYHWEDILLILFCMTIPLQNMGGIMKGMTFAKVFLMAAIFYYFIRAFFRKDMYLFLLPFKSWTSLALLVLLGVNMLSGIHATDMTMYSGFNSRYIMLYVTVLVIGMAVKTKRHLLYAFIAAFLIGSVPNCVSGIVELVTGKQVLKYYQQGTAAQLALTGKKTQMGTHSEGSRRVVSFDGGAGVHAMHFVTYSGLSAIVPFLVRSIWLRLFLLAWVFLNLINVAATGSRTGMIGLFLGYFTFLALIEIKRKYKVLIVVATIVGGLVAVYVFDLPLARFFGRTEMTAYTTSFRIEQYRTAMNMFDRHKFIGIGLGQFVSDYMKYQWNYPGHERWYSVTLLHNSFLRQLAEVGIIGLFFLLLLLFTVCYKQYLIRTRSTDPVLRLLAVGLMCSFIGWCGGLLFYPSFLDEQGWILMGFGIALWNVYKQHEKDEAQAALPAA